MAEYTAITEDGKYLIHYGVKGMRWGKHVSKKDKEVRSDTRKEGIMWPWTPKDGKGDSRPSSRRVDTSKQSGSGGKNTNKVSSKESKADNVNRPFRPRKYEGAEEVLEKRKKNPTSTSKRAKTRGKNNKPSRENHPR